MSSAPNGASSATVAVGMVPFLHFATGDHLYFESWRPTSPGAIAGACIGLVVLALVERWLAASRAFLDSYWRKRFLDDVSKDLSEDETSEKSHNDSNERVEMKRKGTTAAMSRLGTVPPFIASHDVPRGILYAVQSLLTYLLMLAVMTFQAAYFISIVAGLGIGEILFGRIRGGKVNMIH